MKIIPKRVTIPPIRVEELEPGEAFRFEAQKEDRAFGLCMVANTENLPIDDDGEVAIVTIQHGTVSMIATGTKVLHIDVEVYEPKPEEYEG